MLYTIYTLVYILFVRKKIYKKKKKKKNLHMSDTTFDLLPLVFNRGPFECYGRSL